MKKLIVFTLLCILSSQTAEAQCDDQVSFGRDIYCRWSPKEDNFVLANFIINKEFDSYITEHAMQGFGGIADYDLIRKWGVTGGWRQTQLNRKYIATLGVRKQPTHNRDTVDFFIVVTDTAHILRVDNYLPSVSELSDLAMRLHEGVHEAKVDPALADQLRTAAASELQIFQDAGFAKTQYMASNYRFSDIVGVESKDGKIYACVLVYYPFIGKMTEYKDDVMLIGMDVNTMKLVSYTKLR